MKELLGEPYLDLLGQFTDELDRVHEGLTSAIWASLNRDSTTVEIDHYIQEAAHLRLFLG